MATHLEESAQRYDQLQVNTAVRDALAPRPRERLLAVGCGSGTLCRLAAPYVYPDGRIIGLDISSKFAAIARDYARSANLADDIRFEAGQADQLPHADSSFDGAWAMRLLLHAENPDDVVREMARVVRPGGRIVLGDWDFDTTSVDHSDRLLTRRVLHWRTDHKGGDNWSGRRLLARAHIAGLKEIQVIPVVTTARDESAALTHTLYRAAQAARDGGGITNQEHDNWVTELRERVSTGRFFASINYFIIKGIV